MKDIITVQLGKCGNTLGSLFWDDLYYEHNISDNGVIDYSNSEPNASPELFLRQNPDDSYIPRAVLLDPDPAILSTFTSGPLSGVSKNNYVTANNSNDMNYSNALLQTNFIDNSIEAIRITAESCENLNSFQFFHSIGGGTGSGCLKSILEYLEENYKKKEIVTFTCLPSQKISELPLEVLNVCLGLQWLVEFSAISLILDNEKIFDLGTKYSEFSSFEDLNKIMRKHVSDFTSLLRFPSSHLSSYTKIGTYFIPYPRIHFLRASGSYELSNQVIEKNLIESIMKPENIYYSDNFTSINTMTAIGVSRGNLNVNSIKKKLNKFTEYSTLNFFHWAPKQILHFHTPAANRDCEKSFTFVQNSSDIKVLFERLSTEFCNIFREKIWIQSYLKNGMDEMDLTEAESNLNDLCSEYIQWGCDGCCGNESDEEIEVFPKNYSHEDSSLESY